ncbi:MAG: hypothetical protein GF341_04765 [candidate division Zixibacteria bacterium]|nr:hypothetical protein [candidate division Zixibacteria bacterium]
MDWGTIGTVVGGVAAVVVPAVGALWKHLTAKIDANTRAIHQLETTDMDAKIADAESEAKIRQFQAECALRHKSLDETMRRYEGHFETLFAKLDEIREAIRRNGTST